MSPAIAASDRLRRLMAMLPWLMAEGGASFDEVAARFGTTPEQAGRDLEVASMVGIPPYGPGDLLEVVLAEDNWVSVRPGNVFNRPPRLSAAEAFALLAAGRAILAVPGANPDGPLATGLAKVEAALGERGALAVELSAPPFLDVVRQAAGERRTLRVRYWSAWRDEVSEREIDPYAVSSEKGRWHMKALDHASGEMRTFRVDRLRHAELTDARFDPPPEMPSRATFEPGAGATHVVLDLPLSARWVAETYPCEAEERSDRLRVSLTVVGTAWLERLLLRVGAEARVLSPPDLAELGARAAARLLAAYNSSD